MKAKEFFYLLGLKPKPKTFGFAMETQELPREGGIEVAQWLHPDSSRLTLSQAAVDHLRQFLHPGDVAIDIGAHTGDTAIPLALAVGPSGLVLALEPNPYVFPVLERNAAANPGKATIRPLMFAAMRADGVYEFQYGESGYSNGGFHEGMSRWLHGSAFKLRVEGRNLQDYLTRRHPDLVPRLRWIKVDAEGFDLAVLETIEDLIRAQRPFLQVEMFSLRKSTADYRRKLYDLLVGHGYRVHRILGSENFLGDVITPENLLSWNRYDVFCIPKGAPPHPIA